LIFMNSSGTREFARLWLIFVALTKGEFVLLVRASQAKYGCPRDTRLLGRLARSTVPVDALQWSVSAQ